MSTLRTIKKYEGIVIPALVIIYLVRRLFELAASFDQLILVGRSKYHLPWRLIMRETEAYSHELNTMFPMIAGTVLLLGAWYVFHFMVYPRIREMQLDERSMIYTGATLLLIFAGVFLFHYFREYVRYTLAWNRTFPWVLEVDGFKVYSLYRKKTILADMLAVIVVFGTYEVFAQVYYSLVQRFHTQVRPDPSKPGTMVRELNVTFLLPIPVIGFLLTFALIGTLPVSFWRSKSLFDPMIFCGIVVLTAILQSILHHYLMPYARGKQSPAWFGNLAGYVAVCVTGGIILALAGTRFMYVHKGLAVMVMLASSLISLLIAYLRQALSIENKVLQTKVSAKSAELAALRSQINPHFLFNALNSLYTAALKEGSERTADGIQKLGDMMRFMLQENNRDRIPLDKEIEYLHNYIHIQRIRIDESQGIDIRVNIQQPDQELYIAPMMLIPFVENAFKHGISHIHPSWIFITLSFDATRLFFKVHNSVHLRTEHDPEEERSGVGLENVRKRLDLIYPGRHHLEIQQSDQDYFVALTLTYW